MIVITGAAGFIGSCLVSRFNDLGFDNLVLVDDFSFVIKNQNLQGKRYVKRIERTHFIEWFNANSNKIKFVYHIGARTNTIEKDIAIFQELNITYSKQLWRICSRNGIPFIYASSAATYGLGEFGFIDNHKIIPKLNPLNPYAKSKNDFDKWVLLQKNTPPFWAGFKFFNVYGPNEFHKKGMVSVIFNTVLQIKATGMMKLFKSHNLEYKDGEQARDFVYIKDVLDVLLFIMNNQKYSGIYNLGSGKARTFNDLVKVVFKSMEVNANILFVDMPLDLRSQYQYFTQAEIQKLKSIGYQTPFTSLEDGVEDYVKNYLLRNKYY